MFTFLFQNDKQSLYHIHPPGSYNDQGLPGQAPGFAALSKSPEAKMYLSIKDSQISSNHFAFIVLLTKSSGRL